MKKFSLLVAPLEGYSDRPFRKLCFNYGADKTFTEMARTDSLARNNGSSWRRIAFDSTIPTVIQLLPVHNKSVLEFVKMWKERNKEHFESKNLEWNLNLGCPSRFVIAQGLGCAMVKRITKLNEYIKILRQETGFPVSLKLRLGMNQYEKEHKVYMNLLRETEADYYIVHARHGRQKSDSPADWNIYGETLTVGKSIFANGDIRTLEHLKHFQKIGVSGIMLGRVAVQNPALFALFRHELVPESVHPTISKNQIKKEYEMLRKEYYVKDEEASTYRDNFLRHFGNPKYTDLSFTSG